MRVAVVAILLAPLAWLAWALPSRAEPRTHWNRETWAELRPTTERGAVAELVFHNEDVNGTLDNGGRILELGDLAVTVLFTWDANPTTGADRIIIQVPDGYVADTEELTVLEGHEDRALIYKVLAAGM